MKLDCGTLFFKSVEQVDGQIELQFKGVMDNEVSFSLSDSSAWLLARQLLKMDILSDQEVRVMRRVSVDDL